VAVHDGVRLTASPKDRQRALGFALFLDPGSERLAAIPDAEKRAAKARSRRDQSVQVAEGKQRQVTSLRRDHAILANDRRSPSAPATRVPTAIRDAVPGVGTRSSRPRLSATSGSPDPGRPPVSCFVALGPSSPEARRAAKTTTA
jgi:hypothetical protein